MTHRIIITGKNSEMPQDAAQRTGLEHKPRLLVCGACDGTGIEYAYETNDPAAKPITIPCNRCKGEGAL